MIASRRVEELAKVCQDAHLEGLQVAITVADENGCITYLNELAAEHYGDRGGSDLVGTHLDRCHKVHSQEKIRELYARYRAGDLTVTRYRKEADDGVCRSILYVPVRIEGAFAGVAEVIWEERAELGFEV